MVAIGAGVGAGAQMKRFDVAVGPNGTVHLSGELDMASATGAVEAIVSCIDSKPELVLDVSALEFIDSAGIRELVSLARLVHPRAVVVRSPRRNVAEVFKIVDIEALGIRVEHPSSGGRV